MKKRLVYKHCTYVLSQGWCLLALLRLKGIPRCSLDKHLSREMGTAGLKPQTRLFHRNKGRAGVKTSPHTTEREEDQRHGGGTRGRWLLSRPHLLQQGESMVLSMTALIAAHAPVPGQCGSWEGSQQSVRSLCQVQTSPARLNPAVGQCRTFPTLPQPSPTATHRRRQAAPAWLSAPGR